MEARREGSDRRTPNGILPNLHEIAMKRKCKELPKAKESHSQINRASSESSASKKNAMALPDFIMGKILSILDGAVFACTHVTHDLV
jgi:hypothetical protein